MPTPGFSKPKRPQAVPPEEQDAFLARLAQPEVFIPWIMAHAARPQITGRIVFCGRGKVGTSVPGHFVARNQIAAGYRGHYICKDCAERLYGDQERLAQALVKEKRGARNGR